MPMGKDEVVIEIVALIVIDSVSVAVACLGLALSVTIIVNVAVWAVVGVPLITPVEALSVSPAGKDPELMDQEYGVIPTEALSVSL
jgi:hypothetical protein